MTRARGAASRSGDPRKRAAQASAPGSGRRKRAVVAAALAGAGFVAAALLALRPAGDEIDQESRDHAQAACQLTEQAHEAASVNTDARYAAAVLLLDEAIVESAQAAEGATAYAELERAVQALHTAAHSGIERQWRDALDAALAVCGGSFG